MTIISIILNTKNEEKNIGNALRSIAEQTFDKELMEVIVVDNGSVDKTKEIAKKFAPHHKGAGFAWQIFDKGQERSSQKNFGAERASGKYLFFMDADMILSPGVITEAVQRLENDKNLIGLYINERIIDFAGTLSTASADNKTRLTASLQCRSLFCKIRNFERSFYNATVIDAVRFLRRDDFLASGGFDERLYAGEDWDLHKRVIGRKKMDIVKSMVYHNEEGMNLKKLLSKKKYYSGSFEKYISKWSQSSDGIKAKNDPDLKKQFGFEYRFFGVFFENEKWRKVLAHPILYLLILFNKFFISLVYLKSKYGK